MNGKGSRPRPKSVSAAEWDRRHTLTFPPKDWRPVSHERDVRLDGTCAICAKPYLSACLCPDPDDSTLEYREFHEVLFARPKRVE